MRPTEESLLAIASSTRTRLRPESGRRVYLLHAFNLPSANEPNRTSGDVDLSFVMAQIKAQAKPDTLPRASIVDLATEDDHGSDCPNAAQEHQKAISDPWCHQHPRLLGCRGTSTWCRSSVILEYSYCYKLSDTQPKVRIRGHDWHKRGSASAARHRTSCRQSSLDRSPAVRACSEE